METLSSYLGNQSRYPDKRKSGFNGVVFSIFSIDFSEKIYIFLMIFLNRSPIVEYIIFFLFLFIYKISSFKDEDNGL